SATSCWRPGITAPRSGCGSRTTRALPRRGRVTSRFTNRRNSPSTREHGPGRREPAPSGRRDDMSKQVFFRSEARERILKGVTALADAVRVTLGPKSKCVLLEKRFGAPVVCNDGVTIAKEMELR